MMIAGFGPDDEVVVLLLLLLPPPPPPQAVRPIRSATPKEIANAALAARRVCFRNILALLSRLSTSGGPYALGSIRREAARWARDSPSAVTSAIAATQNAAARTPDSPS